MQIGKQDKLNLTQQRTDVHTKISTLLKKIDTPVVRKKLAITDLSIAKALNSKELKSILIIIRDQKLPAANHEDLNDIMRTLHGYDKAISAVTEFSKFKKD